MVALAGLLQLGQMCLEGILGGESRAVDALQHLVVLVALPIRAGALGQLVRLDGAGGKHVRAGAEVDELALAVEADDRVIGQLVDQLHLVGLVALGHERDGLLPGQLKALDAQIFLDDLLHLALERGQHVGREGDLGVEVVVEAAVDSRADGQLGRGVEALDGLCEDMRSGVVEDVCTALVGEGEELDVVACGEGTGECGQLAVDFGGQDLAADQACGLRSIINGCIFFGAEGGAVDVDVHGIFLSM